MTALARPAIYAGVLFALTTDMITDALEYALSFVLPSAKRTNKTDADTWSLKIAKVAAAVGALSIIDIYVFDKAQGKSKSEDDDE